jgi:5-methylthioadenosine/S-adenosylhomocysteine deaminase
MKTIIKNAYVLTMNELGKIYEDGCVLIQDDKIIYVGNEIECPNYDDAKVIDAKNNVLMPGLINAHTHLPMTIFKGYGEGLPLNRWLEEKIWPAEDKMTAEMAYWTSLLGLCEMAMTGTTFFLDMYYLYDGVFKAMEQSGYRGVFSRGVMDVDGKGDERIKEAIDDYKSFHGRANVEVSMCAHAEYTSSSDLLEKIAEVARQYNTGLHIHVSETKQEHMDCIGRHGLSPIQFFDRLGITDIPIAAAHCVYVTEKDMEIMAEKNISVLSCPQSNLKLGSGIAPVKKMLDMGVNVAVGTDGSSSNNNLDMIEDAMLLSLLQRGILNDAAAITDIKSLQLVTNGGAKALGKEKSLGKLKEGFLADIIMIDTDKIEFTPRNDIVSCIVNSGSGRDVCMTMIGGKIVYQDGRVLFADVNEVRRKVQEYADQICD